MLTYIQELQGVGIDHTAYDPISLVHAGDP